jgi:CheY-like chemotaxis protein
MDLIQQLSTALSSAESASRAKTRFLASASHDLRQPIHALSLFTGALQSRPLDQRTASIAGQIHKTVMALASQMDALLDISRLDAGVIQAAIAAVELNPLLHQLADEFGPQAERKGLQFTVANPDLPPVRTDPILLQRILRNLISNAINYTSTGSVDIRVERRGAVVRICVCDSGPGIPLAYRELIFEEFYQLHNPERDRSQGLGLGLAIVRRLTNLLGIALTLESSVGLGSTFSVDLPVALAQDLPASEPTEETADSGHHLRILVIDDEETIRLGMKMLFDEMGFNVCLATSTEGALAAAEQTRPDLVLADLRLRGDDTGLQAIAALRSHWPGLPALLISGDIAPDRLRQARDAGIELLHKPVNAELLRQTILRMMSE